MAPRGLKEVRSSIFRSLSYFFLGEQWHHWDNLSKISFETLDFLKTLSSHPRPKLKFSRDNRWYYLGLVDEPCFEKATGPDADRFGLWLDKRIVSSDCSADPFENETKYPCVKIGARGKTVIPISPTYAQFGPGTVFADPPPPSSQVGSYTLVSLRGVYRFWKRMAAAGYFRGAEVAVSTFNALNDKHKEHPLSDTIGSRGWDG